MATEIQKQIIEKLGASTDTKSKWFSIALDLNRIYANLQTAKEGHETWPLNVDREIINSTIDLGNLLDRRVPFHEIEDLCKRALELAKHIIENQITDRTMLPEWVALEKDTLDRVGKLSSDPRYKHLWGSFPSGL